jgi:hypothetical protein
VHRLVLVICLGCGGSDDPHAAGTCDQGWVQNGFDTCELACENSSIALNASGPACEALTIDNASVSCSKTFEFEGATGCCSVDNTVVHFADCQ